MKKQGLAKRLARGSAMSPAEAADQLDRLVHRIVSGLRKGESVPLPGLGRFKPGTDGAIEFEPDGRGRRDRDGH